MYVDDIMRGANDDQGAVTIQQQLTDLRQTGCFEVHKWYSNSPEVVPHIPSDRKGKASTLIIDSNDTIKAFGLEWSPYDDNFQFSVQRTEAAITKRQVLSAISKFFDPLGLIDPILTSAKLLMQDTWRIHGNWDEILPAPFNEKWEKFQQDLDAIQTLHIPRQVILYDKPMRLFLQGFCDASEEAYGACLYVQAENDNGALTARLLCSKSRVAPIKSMSIPRLEMCSAVLLARLIASVQRSLRVKINGLQAWSDSMVALCWIRGDISRWKTFVANRVSEIIELVPIIHWAHIKGNENPADLISRGTSPRELRDSQLWWSGPPWLQHKLPTGHNGNEDDVSDDVVTTVSDEERKDTRTCNFVNEAPSIIEELIDNFSSITKIERVLAYCLRVIVNLKGEPTQRIVGRLSVAELQTAHIRIIKHAQATEFAKVISTLQGGFSLQRSSKCIHLNPFLDDHGVLRVGGRLQHASLTFSRKHPIILPSGI